MTTRTIFTTVLALTALMAGAGTAHAQQTITNLPAGQVDTLTITLANEGKVSAAPGETTGWGFTIHWTSNAGHWIQFTGSTLGSTDAPQGLSPILGNEGYSDYLGQMGGPFQQALSPTFGPWTLPFVLNRAGLSHYTIAEDAVIGAIDAGRITISFDVYDGNPLAGGRRVGDGSYTYSGPGTAYIVTVVPAPTATERLTGLCAAVQAAPISQFLKAVLCGILTVRGVRVGDDDDRDDRDRDPVACPRLRAFVAIVNAQAGKGIPTTVAASLLDQARSMQSSLGCRVQSRLN